MTVLLPRQIFRDMVPRSFRAIPFAPWQGQVKVLLLIGEFVEGAFAETRNGSPGVV